MKREVLLEKRIKKALKLFEKDPYYPSLKTHKVNSRLFGKKNSIWVTGDIRIIWSYKEGTIEIVDILDIGGHTGKGKVYQ